MLKTAKRQYLREPWLNSKVEIRPSHIHGKGMFATARILQGEIVAIWGGNYVSGEEAEKKHGKSGKRVQQIDDDVFEIFDYESRGDDPTHFHNHSCDPNTWMNDEVTISARRRIERNEELTIDYAMFETNESHVVTEICGCGSALCRGRITGKDWRAPDLQERYRDHFSPLIKRRISESH